MKLVRSSRRLNNLSGVLLDVAEVEIKLEPLRKVRIKIDLFVLRDSPEVIIIVRDFPKSKSLPLFSVRHVRTKPNGLNCSFFCHRVMCAMMKRGTNLKRK